MMISNSSWDQPQYLIELNNAVSQEEAMRIYAEQARAFKNSYDFVLSVFTYFSAK